MRGSVTIDAPPERVFDAVDDWRNTTRFLRGLVRWDPVDPERTSGVGVCFHVGIQAGPRRLTGQVRIVEHERPSRIVFRSVDGPSVLGTWTFVQAGDGTRVELDASYELPGGIAGRLVGGFVSRQGQRDVDGSLADLKRLVESPG